MRKWNRTAAVAACLCVLLYVLLCAPPALAAGDCGAPPAQNEQPVSDTGADLSRAGTASLGEVQSGGSTAREALTQFMESWKTGSLVDAEDASEK